MKVNEMYKIKKSTFLIGNNKNIIKSKEDFKIILINRGSSLITWTDGSQLCNSDDIIIVSPGNSVNLQVLGKIPLEIFEVNLTLELLSSLSEGEVNLINCFNVIPYKCAVVNSNADTMMLLKNISNTLTPATENASDFAQNIYEKSLLGMFVILVLRSAIRAEKSEKTKKKTHSLIDEIIIFIKSHITEEIPLDRLEKEFYISKYHISREFKKKTGLTVHQYIVKSKLELCKRLIEQGKSIVDIYKLCGLGGYNHMFRAFKKEFGITPKEYYKQVTNKK